MNFPTPTKKLNKMKSSRTEILKIHKKVPERTILELEKLKDEVLEWHNIFNQKDQCDFI